MTSITCMIFFFKLAPELKRLATQNCIGSISFPKKAMTYTFVVLFHQYLLWPKPWRCYPYTMYMYIPIYHSANSTNWCCWRCFTIVLNWSTWPQILFPQNVQNHYLVEEKGGWSNDDHLLQTTHHFNVGNHSEKLIGASVALYRLSTH